MFRRFISKYQRTDEPSKKKKGNIATATAVAKAIVRYTAISHLSKNEFGILEQNTKAQAPFAKRNEWGSRADEEKKDAHLRKLKEFRFVWKFLYREKASE